MDTKRTEREKGRAGRRPAPVVADREDLARQVEALLRADARPDALREGLADLLAAGRVQPADLPVVEHMLQGALEAPRAARRPLPEVAGTPRLSAEAGRPLPEATRRRLEDAFQRDLSGIRVHEGEKGAEVAASFGAEALASGRDIFVGQGRSASDVALMGHEVAHVAQGLKAVGLKPDDRAATGTDVERAPVDDAPKPPPPNGADAFVRAEMNGSRVVYLRADGKGIERSGGSRAWRNNNPGNIIRGDFSRSHGAIGADKRFAIFPDADTGFEAIVSLLRERYAELTLAQAIAKWAPPSENDTEGYKKIVERQTGLAATDVIGQMSDADLRKVAGAIKSHEGWIVGTEKEASAPATDAQGQGTSPRPRPRPAPAPDGGSGE